MIYQKGFDMTCSIVRRLLSLLSKKQLDHNMAKFYNFDILSRMVSDLFHILKHQCSLCTPDDGCGLFHPYLSKFKDILKPHKQDKINLLVCEQLWRKWNKLHWLKLSNKAHFECTLSRFQNHINEGIFKKLEKDGYVFQSMQSISRLRSINMPPFRISKQPVIKDLQCVSILQKNKVSEFFSFKQILNVKNK